MDFSLKKAAQNISLKPPVEKGQIFPKDLTIAAAQPQEAIPCSNTNQQSTSPWILGRQVLQEN